MSILIDESTTLSKKSCLVAYIRASNQNSDPLTFFLEVIELEQTTADGITDALLKCLMDNGLDDEFLKQCFLGFCSDGASVMLGRKAGVYAKLKARYPAVVGWHCLNHRLELSVGDAVRSCVETNHFTSFLDKLYCLYSQSPKNLRELDEAASVVGTQLRKIGCVLNVRWVASSYRTVEAVWNMYGALHLHFISAGKDTSRTSAERCMYDGLAAKLSSEGFVVNLGLMLDALEELKDLSEALQNREIHLSEGLKKVKRQADVFLAMMETPGPHYQIACQAVQDGVFKGVPLKTGGRQIKINHEKFFHALSCSMQSRMVPEHELELFDQINVLSPDTWPSPVPLLYGEQELRQLCDSLAMNYCSVKQDFRDYKENPNMAIKEGLLKLKHTVDTLAVSTAECERGFSAMNIIVSPLRNQLKIVNVSSLMFVKLVGPPLELWNPTKFVRKWMMTRRSADHAACRQRQHKPEEPAFTPIWKLMNA